MPSEYFGPCGPSTMWLHFYIATLGSATTILVTWLTVRAKRRDRAENGKRRERNLEP